MSRIIGLEDYQNIKNLQAAIGEGRNLALNPDQTSRLQDNAKNKITTYQNSNITNVSNETINSSLPENEELSIPTIEAPTPIINEETKENVTVNNDTTFPNISVIENSVAIPQVDITPNENESIVMPNPSINPEINEQPQVEIVTEAKENELFNQIMTEIVAINNEYDQKITVINQERAEKIKKILDDHKEGFIAEQSQILDLKNRAEEHLKNAQAAEQIATIAHQNAQNIQNIDA